MYYRISKKSFYIVLFAFLVCMFFYSYQGYAIFGFLFSTVEKNMPQRVYRDSLMEPDYIFKTLKQIEQLETQIRNFEQMINHEHNNAALMNLLLGSESLSEHLTEAPYGGNSELFSFNELFKSPVDEIQELIKNDIEEMFSSVLCLKEEVMDSYYLVSSEINDDVTEELKIVEDIRSEIGNTSYFLQETLSTIESEEIHDLGFTTETLEKGYEERQNELLNILADKTAYYAGIEKAYGNSDLSSSANKYIEMQKENIVENRLVLDEYSRDMTLQAAVNGNTKMILDMHNTQLEMLNALKTLNDQMRVVSQIYVIEHLEEEIEKNQMIHGHR